MLKNEVSDSLEIYDTIISLTFVRMNHIIMGMMN